MTGWRDGDLVLDDSVHFSDCKINSPRKLVLVIDSEPLAQDNDDVWLQNFRDSQLRKLLRLQDHKGFLRFWLLAKSSAIRSRRVHLAEDFLCVRHVAISHD